MSTCISRHGEYSSHDLAESGPAEIRFVCRLCGALAEDALLAAADEADRLRDRLTALEGELRALTDEWANGSTVGYDRNEQVELDTEKAHARALRALLDGQASEGSAKEVFTGVNAKAVHVIPGKERA